MKDYMTDIFQWKSLILKNTFLTGYIRANASATFKLLILNILILKHVRVTPSAKYPFVCHVNLSHKMLPLTLFFPFYFKYFQHKHFSFLKVLDN